MSAKWQSLAEELQRENSTAFHVHGVENVSWRTLLYFMLTKLKSLTGEIYNISCPRGGNVSLECSAIFHIHQVENFSWRSLLYLISTKWKNLTREPYNILFTIFHVHKVEMFNRRSVRYIMSTKWKKSTGELCNNSCPRSRKV